MSRRKIDLHLNMYKKIKDDAPEFPAFTCPYIDSVILELEELRSQNDQLRECAEFWKNQTKKLCKEILELNTHITELEEEDL